MFVVNTRFPSSPVRGSALGPSPDIGTLTLNPFKVNAFLSKGKFLGNPDIVIVISSSYEKEAGATETFHPFNWAI